MIPGEPVDLLTALGLKFVTSAQALGLCNGSVHSYNPTVWLERDSVCRSRIHPTFDNCIDSVVANVISPREDADAF